MVDLHKYSDFQQRNQLLRLLKSPKHQSFSKLDLLFTTANSFSLSTIEVEESRKTLERRLNFVKLYNDIKETNNSDQLEEITINFRFKNSDFMPQRRYRQLTALGLMAESAGLFGLYCGVSILTIVELIHFIMFRWIVDLHKGSRKQC